MTSFIENTYSKKLVYTVDVLFKHSKTNNSFPTRNEHQKSDLFTYKTNNNFQLQSVYNMANLLCVL